MSYFITPSDFQPGASIHATLPIPNATSILYSCWFNFSNQGSFDHAVIAGSGGDQGFSITATCDNDLTLRVEASICPASGTGYTLFAQWVLDGCFANTWYNLAISLGAMAGQAEAYVNGQPLAQTLIESTPAAVVGGELAVFFENTSTADVCFANFYLGFPANFFELNGFNGFCSGSFPVDPGAHGQLPTGSPPLVMQQIFAGGVAADILTNTGSAGINFAVGGGPNPPPLCASGIYPETGLTLNQIYNAMADVPPSISGIDYETPVAMMPFQYLLDSASGGVWTAEVQEFIPALAPGEVWNGFGPPAGVGTHTLQVRSVDTDSVGSATSNEITYTIQGAPPPPPPVLTIPPPVPTVQQVIWTNITGAGAWVTMDAPDPSAWEPGFVNALSWYLAAEIAFSITSSSAVQEAVMEGKKTAIEKATGAEGNEESTVASWNAEWIDVRGRAYTYGNWP